MALIDSAAAAAVTGICILSNSRLNRSFDELADDMSAMRLRIIGWQTLQLINLGPSIIYTMPVCQLLFSRAADMSQASKFVERVRKL